jgi:3'-phosphoadenosine 5'-phosphosulfate sulfotransferase (PAPS reductase)/FAD synthetase
MAADAAFGGARRDEEKSRAMKAPLSAIRSASGIPRISGRSFGVFMNAMDKGESIRPFPLPELDRA